MYIPGRFALSVLLPLCLAPLGVAYGIPVSQDDFRQSLNQDGMTVIAGNRDGNDQFPDLKTAFREGRFEALESQARGVLEANPRSVLAYEVLGTTLLYQGKPLEASQSFRAAVDLAPGFAELWSKLGIALMEAEQLDEAENALQKAIELESRHRVAHQRLGLLYEYLGQHQRAVDHLAKGLQGTPDDYIGVAVTLGRLLNEQNAYQATVDLLTPRVKKARQVPAEAWLILATAQLQTSAPSDAEQSYRNWLKAHPDSREGLVGLAMAQRRAGDLEAARRTAEQLVTAHPDWLAAVQEMAEIHLQRGDLESARPYLDRSIGLGTDGATVEKRVATYYRDQGDPETSIDMLEQLIDSDKADASVYTFLSELQVSQGLMPEGIATLEAATRRFPESAYLHFRLGNLLAAAAKYEEAIPSLKKANSLAGGDARVLESLLVCQARLGHTDDAVDTARAMLALNPDDIKANFLYASRLEVAGQASDAVTAYETLLTVAPDHAPGLNNLAILKTQAGEYGTAVRLASRAVEVGGANAAYFDTLGWAQYLDGNIRAALKTLREAVALAPDHGTIRYHLGAALLGAGEVAPGREELRLALSLGGEEAWMEDARALLN